MSINRSAENNMIIRRLKALQGRFYSKTSDPHLHRLRTCWNCRKSLRVSDLVCNERSCAKLQPIPPESEYLAVMKPGSDSSASSDLWSPSFAMDEKLLKRRFLQLQQSFHPDNFSSASVGDGSAKELHFAQDLSSWLNKAYNTLRDPLTRSQYLLSTFIDDDNSDQGNDESIAIEDGDFLLSVMDVRESIAEASTHDELDRILKGNEETVRGIIEKIDVCFSRHERYPEDVELKREVGKEIRALNFKLKYLYGVEQAARDKLLQVT
eukprot:Partr_v1_DN24556_c0_g1_i1_m19978 putative HscB iron-sulfur cluster co-chaperone homolog (E. coli)